VKGYVIHVLIFIHSFIYESSINNATVRKGLRKNDALCSRCACRAYTQRRRVTLHGSLWLGSCNCLLMAAGSDWVLSAATPCSRQLCTCIIVCMPCTCFSNE